MAAKQIPTQERTYTIDDLKEQAKMGRIEFALRFLAEYSIRANLPPCVNGAIREMYVDYGFITQEELDRQDAEIEKRNAEVAAQVGARV
jgi:hypothetical protein